MPYPRRLTLLARLLFAGAGIAWVPGESSTRTEAIE